MVAKLENFRMIFLDKIVKGNVFGNFSYDLQPSLDYKLVICERWKN